MATPTTTTAYRFYEFFMPVHAPFIPGPHQWPTIVSEFLRPVLQLEKDILYWFCNHGGDFQVCFASDDYARIDAALEQRRQQMNIRTKTPANPAATVATALGGQRFAGEKTGTRAEAARSLLSLQFMHAACALYFDMLVQNPSGQWRRESNKDPDNPHGSAFESLFHLVANLSDTFVNVEVYVRTPFMTTVGFGAAVKL